LTFKQQSIIVIAKEVILESWAKLNGAKIVGYLTLAVCASGGVPIKSLFTKTTDRPQLFTLITQDKNGFGKTTITLQAVKCYCVFSVFCFQNYN